MSKRSDKNRAILQKVYDTFRSESDLTQNASLAAIESDLTQNVSLAEIESDLTQNASLTETESDLTQNASLTETESHIAAALAGDLSAQMEGVTLETDPVTYRQAMNSPYSEFWKTAMMEEWDSLIKNHMWEDMDSL
jgi:hypothetical protein